MKTVLIVALVLFVGCREQDRFKAGVEFGMEKVGYNYRDSTAALVHGLFREPEIDSLWRLANRPSIGFDSFRAHDAMTLGHGIKFNTNKIYTRDQMRDIIKFQLGIVYAYSRADR